MNIYIAGKVTAKERLKKMREAVRNLGFICHSTWMDVALEYRHLDSNRQHFQREAVRDRCEVAACNLFILDTFDESNTGGREYEAGYAARGGTRVWLVGPVRNVFHAEMPRFESWDAVLVLLEAEASS